MKLFELQRDEDETGISGTGVVAQGVIFDNGWCAMVWLTDHTSVAFYTSIAEVVAIHGHDGKTKVMQIADTSGARGLVDNITQDHMENVNSGYSSWPKNAQDALAQRESLANLFARKRLTQ